MKKIQSDVKKITSCRACKGTKFKPWINLGNQPLANALLTKKDIYLMDLTYFEKYYPLKYVYCTKCELVQSEHVVNPDLLFSDYLYQSSTSPVFRKHFEALANEEFFAERVVKDDLVVDIGSNDGILLKPFKKQGARVLGIEPATAIAAKAIAQGITTVPSYFSKTLAGAIRDLHGEAKLITATNVFAHVDDLDEIIDGVKFLLADNGRFMIEVAYLPRMLEQGTFDLLYHEHLCAWHLYPLQVFFARNGMYIDEVQFIPVHGGSIRVYAKLGKPENIKHKASDYGLTKSRKFLEFPAKVKKNKEEILKFLNKIVKSGKKIVGYGAPAKMSTMTNYFDIGTDTILTIIDDAKEKQGLYTPGKHIKIIPYPDYAIPLSTLYAQAAYIFIFAWNFADSIIEKMKRDGYKGKFIIPFPKVRIV